MKQIYLLFCLICFLFSCEKEITPIVKTIDLEPFKEIVLNDAFEVFLAESSNLYSIEIIGDEDIVGFVHLEVKDNILSIENNKKDKWLSPIKNKIQLYVTSLPLEKIKAAEGCNIQTLSPITSIKFGLVLTGKANQANLKLDGNEFYYWNDFPSGGKLTLSGRTGNLVIWNFAIMSVDAKGLISEYAFVENSSKGDCEITVLNKLEYTINGEGNIQLYGNPSEIICNGLFSSGMLIQHK